MCALHAAHGFFLSLETRVVFAGPQTTRTFQCRFALKSLNRFAVVSSWHVDMPQAHFLHRMKFQTSLDPCHRSLGTSMTACQPTPPRRRGSRRRRPRQTELATLERSWLHNLQSKSCAKRSHPCLKAFTMPQPRPRLEPHSAAWLPWKIA